MSSRWSSLLLGQEIEVRAGEARREPGAIARERCGEALREATLRLGDDRVVERALAAEVVVDHRGGDAGALADGAHRARAEARAARTRSARPRGCAPSRWGRRC